MIKELLFNKCYALFFFVLFLAGANSYGQKSDARSTLAPPAPLVSSPVFFCQNAPLWSLSQAATPAPGATLNWYLLQTGGTASATPPVPSTTVLGDVTYYVSQTDITGESPRVPIIVRTVTQVTVGLRCDAPNNTATTVAFDWSNLVGHGVYSYSYSVNGGPVVTGTQFAPSSFHVPVPGPNIPVTFSITAVGNFPCYVPETVTCARCVSSVVPTFGTIQTSYCQGETPTPLPTTSTNSPAITGTWSPPLSTANVGTQQYTFTPAATFPCASQTTINIITSARPNPIFDAGTLPPTQICQNAAAPTLPTSTNNPTPITGTWNPATVNTAVVGPPVVYTFIPNAGQCVSATPFTTTVEIRQNVPLVFATTDICSGSTAPSFPSTSGVTGTWSPTTISNTQTKDYTFNPNPGQCSAPGIWRVNVKSNVTTSFTNITNPNLTICSGDPVPTLSTSSNNSPPVTGTWSSATVSNIASGTYTFTPTAGQCASPFVLTVNVTPRKNIQFTSVQSAFSLCIGQIYSLPSTDSSGITGTWSPSSQVNTSIGSITQNYTFTATAGQCVNSPTFVTAITITDKTTPDFAAIPTFCVGEIPARPDGVSLSATSPNGVVGVWTPSTTINNSAAGFFQYKFTPLANQCAFEQILNITITPKITPTFPSVAPFCSGEPAPVLPLVSDNGITGQWSPATVDNTMTAPYQFIPDAGQCAESVQLTVNVTQPVDPKFEDITFCFGTTVPVLDNVSPAPDNISGTWIPAVIDDTVNGASYVFTPDAGECANPKTITVTINQDTLADVTWTATSYFSDNATIVVTATAAGNYLYQLDFGPLYTSNIFDNVTPGLHSITVYDANGCSAPIIKTDAVRIIDYPHFFTSNGDGINDTWNIFDLADVAPYSEIYIFDRYGKLLKQISPLGLGWDGTYNGQPMPSSDYWFLVKYDEVGTQKEFKSHFSLKR
jgi:gliding motility-associated-like protein